MTINSNTNSASSANACLDPYRTGRNRTVTNHIGSSGVEWNQIQDGDLDSITVETTSDWHKDPVAAIREWRRTLKEGGTLAVALLNPTQGIAPQAFATLIKLVGGFLHGALRPVGGGTLLFVGNRARVADIRAPMSVLGEGLVKAATDTRARGELYFQIGTVFLQIGDYTSALGCFENLKTLEPDSAEALFGLGMCETLRGNYGLAISLLEQAGGRDPRNPQIPTWIELARANWSKVQDGTQSDVAGNTGNTSPAPANANLILNPQPATVRSGINPANAGATRTALPIHGRPVSRR
jgi:tetratricopeptide (TPR) repeat protein